MQIPAVLDTLGLALAGCLPDLPDRVRKAFALLGAVELGLPLERLLLFLPAPRGATS